MTRKLHRYHNKWTQYSCCLCLFFCFITVASPAADIDSALNSKQLNSALKPAEARIRIQVDYATNIGWQTINYLTAYLGQFQTLPLEKEVESFTAQLLQNNRDPFVKAIFYIPAQAIIIEMHTDIPVETSLRNGFFIFRFDTLEWTFNPSISRNTRNTTDSPALFNSRTTRVGVYFLDIPQSMATITNYCQNPQGYQAIGGQMNDITWCPLWHLYVMPVP